MNKYLFVLMAPFVFASQAFAQGIDTSYSGFQYAIVNYEEDGFPDARPSALVGRLGTFLSDNFALEARIGFGLQDDTITESDPFLGDIDLDLEVDSIFGVYGVLHSGNLGLNDLSLYGVFGFTRAELSASSSGITVSGDDSSMSFGLGAQLGAFNLELMSYLREDSYDASAISIGYVSEF